MQDIYLKESPILKGEDITSFVGRVIAEYDGDYELLPIEDINEFLIDEGAIIEYSPGQYVYTDKSASIINALYNFIYYEVAKPLGFSHWIFPRLHKIETANAFGLVEAWPYYLLEVKPYDNSRKVQTIREEETYILDPVQCLALYELLKNKPELRKKPMRIMETIGGFTFRNEDGDKLDGVIKSIEFLRVELLYYDTRDVIIKTRQEIMNALINILSDWKIKWRVVVGMGCYEYPSKEELCMFHEASKVGEIPVLDIEVLVKDKGQERWIELAGCSLEYDLKVKRFSIEDGLESGCVGIGMGRFLAAVCSYYSPSNVNSFPQKLKKFL